MCHAQGLDGDNIIIIFDSNIIKKYDIIMASENNDNIS
jgi:hypothetical protein